MVIKRQLKVLHTKQTIKILFVFWYLDKTDRIFFSDVKEYVIKAQILAGGRGKGHFDNGYKGGVQLTKKYITLTVKPIPHTNLSVYVLFQCG